MTAEMEKEFFETFNIKSEMGCTAYEKLSESKADSICTDYCPECKHFEDVYPKITDKILLELICICNCHAYYGQNITPITTKNLKKQVLYHCEIFLKDNEDARTKIQNLFI